MSTVPFDSTITLFTPLSDGGYEKKIIPYVHAITTDGIDINDCRATIYIPIYGKRSLKYVSSAKRADGEHGTFTVKAGQYVVPYTMTQDSPPEGALVVSRVTEYYSGSRRIQHVKITACKIPEETPDETPEGTTDETTEGTTGDTTEEEQGSTSEEVTQ